MGNIREGGVSWANVIVLNLGAIPRLEKAEEPEGTASQAAI